MASSLWFSSRKVPSACHSHLSLRHVIWHGLNAVTKHLQPKIAMAGPLLGCSEVVTSADTGEVFTTPIATALRFVNFRLPFTSFRYSTGGQGPSKLDPSRLVRLSVRYANLQDAEVHSDVLEGWCMHL